MASVESNSLAEVEIAFNAALKSLFLRKKWVRVPFILACIFMILGVVGFTVLPTIIRYIVRLNMILSPGKEVFDKWKETPIPVTFKVYLFNVTNHREVLNGSKPIVEEVGPFVFEQRRSKQVLEYGRENLTITYRDQKQYFFLKEQSADIESKIYTVNLPLQGILMFIKKLGSIYRSVIIPGLEGILKNYEEHVFSHRTARELMFEGYKVDLIQDLVDLAGAFVTVPEILPNNTFGYLYGKNNSGDGIFTVFTGIDDIAKYSQIVTWNNMSRIPYWNNEYCNMMNGTDGAQFPPPVTPRDVLYVYAPDLCRSISLEYSKDVTIEGIPALRFVTPEHLFASPLQNPDNMCYCTEPEYCELSGILDISPCKKGLKLAVTGPHFFLAHRYVTERVEGLHPNRELHESYVDVEPTTGVVLGASRKLQMNFILDKFEEMEDTKHLPMSVLPLLWVVEEASVTPKVATEFIIQVRAPVIVAKSVLTACVVLGVLWILTAGASTLYILAKEQKTAKAAVENRYKQYKQVPQKPEDILKSEKKFVNA